MFKFKRISAVILTACVAGAVAQAPPAAEKQKTEQVREDISLELQADLGEFIPNVNVNFDLAIPEAELKEELTKIEKLVGDDKLAKMTAKLKNAQGKAFIQAQNATVLAQPAADDVRRVYGLRARAEKEMAAYLGVSTSPVNAALREQLKLQKGVGLVVEHVDSDSPAEKAGLKKYDIIQKLNDQLLINSHQLAVLVRTFKPGDDIDLAILREGKPQSLNISLIEKEVAAVQDGGNFVDFVPGDWTRWTNDQLVAPPAPVAMPVMPAMPKAAKTPFRTIRARNGDDGREINYNDNEHNMTLKPGPEGKRTLRAEDKTGNVIYEGPLDEKEKMPAEIAGKLSVFGTVDKRPLTLDVNALPKTDGQIKRDMEFNDDQHTITLKFRKDAAGRRTTMRVRDRKGKELFNGSIDTPEQRDALSDEVKAKLELPAVKQFIEEADKMAEGALAAPQTGKGPTIEAVPGKPAK